MASGIILGFFTGNIYGLNKPQVAPSNITRINYAILKSLIRNQGYNREDIIAVYKSFDTPLNENHGYSHDSLTRSMLWVFINDMNIVIEDTNLTNSNPINRDAGLLYVLALKFALQKKDPKEIFGILQNSAQTSEIRTILLYISQGKTIDMSADNIFTAFYAAITPFVHAGTVFHNWTEGVEWVTRLGGNQAVNAAMAGSLLGAYFGSERMFDEASFGDRQITLLGQFPEIYELNNEIELIFPFFVSDLSRRLFLAYRQTLNEMRNWSQKNQWNFFESRHDFIQIVFPTTQAGTANRSLVPNMQEIQELNINKEFIQMMREAFTLILQFYGLTLINNKINITDKDRFVTYFLYGGSDGHNHLRITRILTSLRIFQQLDLYLAFKEFTNQVAETYPLLISNTTKNFWEKA
jgi:hypothetical protein